MAKDPAVLFYTADFRQGTILLTNEQVGQYIRLLCDQHQNGHLPENHMINICLSHDSPVIKKFKKDENGFYYNERMEKEIKKRVNYCKSRSNNKSGRPAKKSYDNHMNNHMYNHMLLHMENENDNSIISINSLGKYENPFFLKFKQAYPKNGSSFSPNVENWFISKETEKTSEDSLELIIKSAFEYSEYCKTRYPETYPHGSYIKQAENWLNENQYKVDWIGKLNAFKIENKKGLNPNHNLPEGFA